jgi:hypothetical protein
MDTLRFVAELGNERFEIVEGRGEGFYVFRYIGGQNTHDYLQPDVPLARRCAEDKWGVSQTAWRDAFPAELPWWQQKV